MPVNLFPSVGSGIAAFAILSLPPVSSQAEAIIKESPPQAASQENSSPRPVDFTKIPICAQPKDKPWCGVATSMTMSQVFHGFDLSNNLEVMQDFTRLMRLRASEGGGTGGSPGTHLGFMGIDVVMHDPALKMVFSTDQEADQYAEKILMTEVRDALQNGKLVGLCLSNINGLDHEIALLGYSETDAKFHVSDPWTNKLVLLSAKDLGPRWSDKRKMYNGYFKGSHVFRWDSVDCSAAVQVKSSLSGGYLKTIPNTAEVVLDDQCKALVFSRIDLACNNVGKLELSRAITDANFRATILSWNWEPGTELECLKGLRSVVRLSLGSSQRKQEQGLECDAFMVLIPEGDKVQAVAISGIKTSGDDLLYQVVSKSGTTWMKADELYKLMIQCTYKGRGKRDHISVFGGYYRMPPVSRGSNPFSVPADNQGSNR